MKPQNFQILDALVVERFVAWRRTNPGRVKPLNLSWSNWGFGIEPLSRSAARLARWKVPYIELHGNRYGKDLGYNTAETRKILGDNGIKVSGVCGMVSPESELSSTKPHITQRSIDYFRRNIELCAEMGGTYVLFTPGAVGRPTPYDDNEMYRAAEAIRILGDDFVKAGVRAAIEPVRSAEVSFCHTFAEAKRLIEMVDHLGVRHIAGDVYHMHTEEDHISKTLLDYGHMLTNLHLADSNRGALGRGSMNLDLVIMALYAVDYNNERSFCSAEPLGPGGDPYPQMFGSPSPDLLDDLVRKTAETFFERERLLMESAPEELLRTVEYA